MKDMDYPDVQAKLLSDDDCMRELKAFDDSKAGVKGLVDAGMVKIPPFFIEKQRNLDQLSGTTCVEFSIPIINLDGEKENSALRGEIVNKIREASEKYGIFQIVNHGIPANIMQEMMNGVRKFHEQDTEMKKPFYSRDRSKSFFYYSSYGPAKGIAGNWRDTIECSIVPPPDSKDLPAICRDIMFMYSNYVMTLGLTLFELTSEALGLNPNHLKDMHCAEGIHLGGNYYPACPEPDLTLGAMKHTDSGFITILQQDDIGGLQFLHENQWVNIPYFPGALVVNNGDLLQIISNDKFKSVLHRVRANKIGPRISVACGFRTNYQEFPRLYGPIRELLSENNPPVYRDISVKDFLTMRYNRLLQGSSPLTPLKLNKQDIED